MVRKLKLSRLKIAKPDYMTLGHILPNICTLGSVAASMTAIMHASRGGFSTALALIIVAAVLDGLDGRLARAFKTDGPFGVEMDSLCDAISFGVAPAFITFFYAAHKLPGIGWALSLVFASALILRLARFNVMTGDDGTPDYWRYFFTGVPAPAAGLMVLWPIALYTATGNPLFASPVFVSAMVAVFAFGAISRIPTFNLKKVSVPKWFAKPLMLIIFATIMAMTLWFWKVAAVLGAVYIATIPYTIVKFLRMKRAAEV